MSATCRARSRRSWHDAFVLGGGVGPGLGKKEEEEKARKVHQDFLRYYKAEGVTAQEVPLLNSTGTRLRMS